jgi:La-related protein 7
VQLNESSYVPRSLLKGTLLSQASKQFDLAQAEDGTGDMGPGRGRGRGRGGRGRGRGYHHQNNNQHNHHQNNRSSSHLVGTPPASHPVKVEQQEVQPQPPTASNKQPLGPLMPDGTRGFSMGRGKPQTSTSSSSANQPEP